MTEIMIFAEVDGVVALAHITTDLKWIPVNMGAKVETDMLPSQIRKIEIMNDRGMFIQDLQARLVSQS